MQGVQYRLRVCSIPGGDFLMPGLPNAGYTGMCHRPGSIFHFQKSRTGLFGLFSRTGPDFQSFTPEQDRLLKIWSQTSKMQVAFLENDQSNPSFLSKKYARLLAKDTECVPVTIIMIVLYSNKVMLPVGALVSCSLMLTYSCKKE